MRRHASSTILLGLLAFALTTAIACQPATPSPNPQSGATVGSGATAPPAASSKRSNAPADTVVIGTNRSPDTLDPHVFFSDAWPEPLYLYLVTSTKDKFEPALAASWQFLDPQRVQFTLREGITFEDGKPVTSADVKASYDRVANPQFAAGSQVRQYIRGLTGVTVDDARRFTISAGAPDPLIVGRLWRVGIMSEEWIAGKTPEQITTTANGNGPYKVTEFIPKTRIAVEKRTGSAFDGTSQKLVLESLPEYASRVAALRSGQIDLAEEVNADDASPLRSEGFTVDTFRRASGIAMGISPVEQFADIRVRQAMDLAIDRQGIVEQLYAGTAQALPSQPTPEGIPGYNSTVRAEFDVARARRLLAEAGFPNGFSASLKYPPQNVPMTTVSSALPGMFQQAGLNISLEAVEQAVFLQRGVQNPNGNGPLFMALASFLVPDASWHLSFWQVPNNRGFANPEFNPLYQRSQVESDQTRRLQQLEQLVKQVSDEKLFLYIVAPGSTTARYPGISGFDIGLVGFQRYFDLAKTP